LEGGCQEKARSAGTSPGSPPYYKDRYRDEHHLTRYDDDTIERLGLAA
jgi:hypothetical protein